MASPASPALLAAALDSALTTGDAGPLAAMLQAHSGLPGPRLNLSLVAGFADLIGERVQGPAVPVARLEALLDGWASSPPTAAPGDQPPVILPCAALVAYGEVGARRPEWWGDEMAKLRRAAPDSRWRVREAVVFGLQRLLAADWERTVAALAVWAADEDPLVARAAAAGVAEPPLLGVDAPTGTATAGAGAADRVEAASAVLRAAIANLARRPAAERRRDPVRKLRQALAFAPSVVVAAGGDLTLLDEMVRSGDPDLRWAARQNLGRARLKPWAAEVARLRRRLDG